MPGMDTGKTSNNLNSKKQKGCFLSQWMLITLFVGAILCVMAVGVLVNYFTPCNQSVEIPTMPAATSEEMPEKDTTPRIPLPYLRLPRSIVPEHYDIELQPYLIEDNFTFTGKVRIVLKVLEPTYNVTLHSDSLKINGESVKLTNLHSGLEQEIVSKNEDHVRNFYVVHLKSSLKEGDMYEIYMEYTGDLWDALFGFYRTSYTDADGNKRWIAATKFEPTYARLALPCFDEPALRATFNVTIVRWRNMTAISNMPKYKTENRGDEWVADYFEETVRMSTYLLAFIVCDFKSLGTPEFSVWSRESVLNKTLYALDIGPKILEFFVSYFNVPYSLPKLDMIAFEQFISGAMENWGVITYREERMLYDDRYSLATDKEKVSCIIAHELAHQWFGNLVTLAWWDNLWLNEGFATYLKYIGVNNVYPHWNIEELSIVHQMQDVLDMDCRKYTRPLSKPVNDPRAIKSMFDRITYAKGCAIVRMIRYILGDRYFRTGLTNYLNAKKYGSATQDDLWEHLTAVQRKDNRVDMKTVMDSWTLQAGYPVVEVIRNYTDGTADINQYRFWLTKEDEIKEQNHLWEIPFTYTTGPNPNWRPNRKFWLHKTNATITSLPSPKQWIIGNLQQIGYYRVNYDEHNWRLLIQQLHDDHTRIHTINRAQLIDDSLYLARAGQLDYSTFLNISMYLKAETEYIPWKTALNEFSVIEKMVFKTPVYGMWKRHVKNLMKSLYGSLGWEVSADESIQKQYLRIKILDWMCRAGHNDCVKTAQVKFEEWMQDPMSYDVIPADLRRTVFCTAVRHGDEEVWNFLWERSKNVSRRSERDEKLHSLACTTEPWLLLRYMNYSFDEGFQYTNQVFDNIESELYGRELAINFIQSNWDFIHNVRDGYPFGLIKRMTSNFNTQFAISQLRQIFNSHTDTLKDSEWYLKSAIENIEEKVKWMENYYEQIADWLKVVTSN